MTKFTVTANVRNRGAIGIFSAQAFVVESPTETPDRDQIVDLFLKTYGNDWELHNVNTFSKVSKSVDEMSVDERRARIAEISALSAKGDVNWSYDELLLLRQGVPEEAAALDNALRRSRTGRLPVPIR